MGLLAVKGTKIKQEEKKDKAAEAGLTVANDIEIKAQEGLITNTGSGVDKSRSGSSMLGSAENLGYSPNAYGSEAYGYSHPNYGYMESRSYRSRTPSYR